MLLREASSSAAATHSTLLKLAKSPTLTDFREDLLRLAGQAEAVQRSAKADALRKLLEAQARSGRGAHEKVIIFTQFRATLEMLAEKLRAWGFPFALYHGGLSRKAKDQAIRDFQAELPILLSTEAAGEGRNLQFCRVMVNFDLPWNPQRIEQRVGRIHRIGQEQPVDIFNLTARGSIEEFVLDILDRKLNMFELVIGEMDMILGQLSDERDFEETVLEIWARARDEEDFAAGMNELGEELVKARSAYQKMKEYDEALFGEDFSTE
jgi:SNF2 family DNA or RNA helicase